MNEGAVTYFEYGKDEFVIPEKEYRKYLGIRPGVEADPRLEALIADCAAEVREHMRIRGCARVCPVTVTEGPSLSLGFAETQSSALAKNISGCDRAVVYAVTAGAEIDRLIAKYGKTSTSRAVVLDAVASAAAEGAAEEICRAAEEEFGKLRPRFSPGFGDLPLSLQGDLLRYVDAGRKAGIRLTQTMMLVPSKSTTAIVGIIKGGENQ